MGFVAVSSIGFLWAWRYCGYKTGLLFGNASGTNVQMTPSYLVDSMIACITILVLPVVLGRLSLRDKRALTAFGAATMSLGTLLSGFATIEGALGSIMISGALTGLGSGILYVLSGLGYVYETTDRLETIVPLNMVWVLPGIFIAPLLAGTPGGIVFVALLPVCAGAIIWCGLPRLEAAQLPTDMNEMPCPSRRFIVAILACTALFEIAACSRVASPLIASVTGIFGSYAHYYQVVSLITFAILIPASLLLIASSRRVNILTTFRRMMPLLIIAAITNLPTIPPSVQLAGAFVNAFANTFLTLNLYIWAFGLAKRGVIGPNWSFSLYMGVMIGGISLGNVVGLLVPTGLPIDTTSHIHIFIMVTLFALVLMILPERPHQKEAREATSVGRLEATSAPMGARFPVGDVAGCTATALKTTTPTKVIGAPTMAGTPSLTEAPNAASVPLAEETRSTVVPEEPLSDVERFTAVAHNCGLTSRELEICLLLAQGRSRPYIREKLVISKSTVDTHARHAYAKLGIHSNQELIDLFSSE